MPQACVCRKLTLTYWMLWNFTTLLSAFYWIPGTRLTTLKKRPNAFVAINEYKDANTRKKRRKLFQWQEYDTKREFGAKCTRQFSNSHILQHSWLSNCWTSQAVERIFWSSQTVWFHDRVWVSHLGWSTEMCNASSGVLSRWHWGVFCWRVRSVQSHLRSGPRQNHHPHEWTAEVRWWRSTTDNFSKRFHRCTNILYTYYNSS